MRLKIKILQKLSQKKYNKMKAASFIRLTAADSFSELGFENEISLHNNPPMYIGSFLYLKIFRLLHRLSSAAWRNFSNINYTLISGISWYFFPIYIYNKLYVHILKLRSFQRFFFSESAINIGSLARVPAPHELDFQYEIRLRYV